jgi:hypothetical protein
MTDENGNLIEVRVLELKQLFNAIDPSPFREKDLDPAAEKFIVSWSQDLPTQGPLTLLVHVGGAAGGPEEACVLKEAVHANFSRSAEFSRRRLRQLFRVGRVSLLIGMAFLASSFALGRALGVLLGDVAFGSIARESLLIGGWVAMWKPLEIFLYDWWPIRAEARLHDRLAAMQVRIEYDVQTASDALRSDWPAASPHSGRPRPRDQSRPR